MILQGMGLGTALTLQGFGLVAKIVEILTESVYVELGERKDYVYRGEVYNLGHGLKKYALGKERE